MRRCLLFATVGALASVAAIGHAVAAEEDSGPTPEWFLRAIQSKAANARQYAFDATLQIARKDGEEPAEVLGSYKVKQAIAPEGKYLLWVSDRTNLQYLIVSDGLKTWALMPSEKSYVEIEASPVSAPPDPAVIFAAGISKSDGNPVLCSKLMVPVLGQLGQNTPALLDLKKFPNFTADGEEREPVHVLTVLSGKSDKTGQSMTELVLDPRTLTLSRMEWRQSAVTEEPRFAVITADFENLALGDVVPASHFFFSPGDAVRVAELPVPGFHGGDLLGTAAPEFELENQGGQKVRPADLRGKTVLLAFAGDECPACEKQLTALATFRKLRRTPEIVVLNAGSRNAGLLHRYGVQFVPTLIAINPEGKVAAFLPGYRDGASLDGSLKAVGL